MRILIAGINVAKAETLTFKNVLEKAVANSYDLKMSQIDIKIAQTEIKQGQNTFLLFL